MAISEHAAGTQTAVVATEHFLGSDPEGTDGAFQFVVDLSNLVRGDTLEIRLYEAALSTDTTSPQVQKWTIYNEQDDKMWMSPALLLLNRWRFSVKQTAGTAGDFKWSIRKVS